MSTEDGFFGCATTPLHFPASFDLSTIPDCTSCTLRLSAPIAGSSLYTNGEFSENPTASFYVNGMEYNCRRAMLSFPAVHTYPSSFPACIAELYLVFQGVQNPDRFVCIVVPIAEGSDVRTNPYFATLGRDPSRSRPTMETLFTPTSEFVSYIGAQLLGRTSDAPMPNSVCNPVKQRWTYYILQSPVFMHATDTARLSSTATVKFPKGQESAASQIVANCTRIRGLRLGDDRARAASAPGAGVSTSAMKCYRLDTTRDIVDGKVYVGGKGAAAATLDKEMEQAATDLSYAALAEDGGIKPGDVERVTGIAIGVVLGLLLVCALLYYGLQAVFGPSYMSVLRSSAEAIAEANTAAAAAAAGAAK